MQWLSGRDLYRAVITEGVLRAERSVWIATANLKDLYVPGTGRRYRPILDVFGAMARDGVEFRIIHAELPSRSFRESFDALPALVEGGVELQICPRNHWKIVIVDGVLGYTRPSRGHWTSPTSPFGCSATSRRPSPRPSRSWRRWGWRGRRNSARRCCVR